MSMSQPGSLSTKAAPDGSMKPEITPFTLGPFQTNCYVVRFPTSTDCWLIDASFGMTPVIEHVRAAGLTPTALILTHAHVDHIAGVSDVRAAFPGIPVYLHEAEQDWLGDPLLNLSAMMGMPVTAAPADRLLTGKAGETLVLESRGAQPLGPNIAGKPGAAGEVWMVIHTPGHSPGGITLYHEPSGTAIVGDTLFRSSIGRSDFPGSDPATLRQSIVEKLYTLPPMTTAYPGHGPETVIDFERKTNPFVRGSQTD